VGSVVVAAVKRPALGALAHVGEEVGEAIGATPPLTHVDAPAAVAVVAAVVGVSTTLVHRRPRPIQLVTAQAVRTLTNRRQFSRKTPARCCVAAAQTAAAYQGARAAVALTPPSRELTPA